MVARAIWVTKPPQSVSKPWSFAGRSKARAAHRAGMFSGNEGAAGADERNGGRGFCGDVAEGRRGYAVTFGNVMGRAAEVFLYEGTAVAGVLAGAVRHGHDRDTVATGLRANRHRQDIGGRRQLRVHLSVYHRQERIRALRNDADHSRRHTSAVS